MGCYYQGIMLSFLCSYVYSKQLICFSRVFSQTLNGLIAFICAEVFSRLQSPFILLCALKSGKDFCALLKVRVFFKRMLSHPFFWLL